MEWQPGAEEGPDEESGSGLPGGAGAARDARLAGFARGGKWDSLAPSAGLAVTLEGVSGAGWRCQGAERDELFGVLRRWAALESWAAASKLGLLRALIRVGDLLLPGDGHHGDLPDEWSQSLTHEVSAALALSPRSAESLMWLAWDLQATLPGIGGLLADGTLAPATAKAVAQALDILSDDDKARAEAMILPHLAGKTYLQAERLALQAAIATDPDSAARRREDAERRKSQVRLKREPSGAASLSGYDLPTDETLAAYANVCARAQEYKDSGVFPDVRMDQFRARAYLDILNGIAPEARIAAGQPDFGLGARPGDGPDYDSDGPDDDGPDDDGPDDDGPQDDGPDGNGPDGCGSSAVPSAAPPRLTDLVLPLATLLGRAWRPGESHGLGPLDPDLCRTLAAAAASSPHSVLCLTVTGPEGYAIGHGCARAGRGAVQAHRPPVTLTALPARMNLTITSTLLAELARATGPPPPREPGRWSFTRVGAAGSPGGDGTWELTLPDGTVRTVRFEPVPTFECDHHREAQAYQPGDMLRHQVQVRDGECTFPTCSRHARESDFEHAVPYHRGGRTCGCNAGARSRQCHRVKQSPGWSVTQPRPGWHRWTTPSGRVYVQEPKRYPV